jgi:hypothetical protein
MISAAETCLRAMVCFPRGQALDRAWLLRLPWSCRFTSAMLRRRIELPLMVSARPWRLSPRRMGLTRTPC